MGYAQNKITNNNYTMPPGSSEKTSDTGFKIYGGYQFSKNWAVEAEYVNFGQYKETEPAAHSIVKASGFGVSAVGTLPLSDQFALFGKLGVLAKSTDTNDYNATGNSVYSQSKITAAALLGLGAEYRFTQNLALRAEYEYAGKTSVGENGGKLNNSLLSVSARYSF